MSINIGEGVRACTTPKFRMSEIGLGRCVGPDYTSKDGQYKRCVGLDFETMLGYGFLLADSDGNYITSPNPRHLYNFLLRPELHDTFNFFYNIRYDFNALIKTLPKLVFQELYKEGKVKLPDYLKPGYTLTIKFVPAKRFELTNSNGSRSGNTYRHNVFYDLQQFYEMSLKEAGKRYSTLDKTGDNFDMDKLGSDLTYWQAHYPDIVKYCINDCMVTADLGERVQKDCKSRLGFYPKSYISKAGVAVEYLLRETYNPNVKLVQRQALDLAAFGYSGGWFECMAKGHFDQLYVYDINSAYPKQIRELIDVTTSPWKRVKSLSDEAYYGVYKVVVHIPEDPHLIPPIPYRSKQGTMLHPTGTFITSLNKQEVEAYRDRVDIEITTGYEYYPDEIIYPYREVIDKLYAWKQSLDKNSYEYALVKKVANSMYGKMVERIIKLIDGRSSVKAGKLFNPIYADIITSGCQIQLWDAMMIKPDDVVGCATDSVMVQSKLNLPLSKKLGDWSLDAEGSGELLESGIYRVNDGYKNRGTRKGAIYVPGANGDKPYTNLIEYIQERPELSEYTFEMQKVRQFGEVVTHTKKLKKWDLNLFVKTPRTVSLNNHTKRSYSDDFKDGKDFLSRAVYGTPYHLKDPWK